MTEVEFKERKQLADRVAAGRELAASPKLRSFFLYVVDCSLREHPEEATEQQIGVKIFGRRPGYNSGDDSIVRAQARLLRQKLTSYFAAQGAGEPSVIDMPKGRYLLSFHQRTALLPAALGETAHREFQAEGTDAPETQPAPLSALPQAALPHAMSPQAALPPAVSRRIADRRPPTFWVCLGLALGLLAGGLLGAGSYRQYLVAAAPHPDPLWSPFFSDAHPTLVIYSNPLFRGSPAEGLHLVDPDRPSAAGNAPNDTPNDTLGNKLDNTLDDTYTGTGEVQAIHTLTRFFDRHGAVFTLKRSRLVTWDQARSSNLIFVGAPSQNTALHDLPARSEFTIAQDAQARGYIVNQHPRPGEPAVFPTNDRTQETAVVASLPGMETGTGILVISGLTTIGTQMAAEFLCRPENLRTLAEIVGTTSGGTLRPFEAVLHVGISKGVGVRVQLATVHRRG